MKTLAELFEELEKLPLECEAGPMTGSAVYRMLKAEALAQSADAVKWRVSMRPLQPLAMGNYEMVAHVQPKAEPR